MKFGLSLSLQARYVFTASALTLMAIQTRKQLLAELEEAGLDDDELDLLWHELELDPGADDYDESDEELTSDDSDRHVVMASS